jgi:hypothetical protein
MSIQRWSATYSFLATVASQYTTKSPIPQTKPRAQK